MQCIVGYRERYVSRAYAIKSVEKKEKIRRFREDNNAETVGAKCYFLSLALHSEAPRVGNSRLKARAHSRHSRDPRRSLGINGIARSGESKRTRRVVIEYVISTSFDGNGIYRARC